MDQSSTQAEMPIEATLQPSLVNDKQELKQVLTEARNNRDMLVSFRAAVESGTFHGSKMLDVAKGCAFLEAILKQNNAHIHSIQERLDK